MSLYKHILMAADLSTDCERIGAHAVQMARLCQARFSLLHVVEQVPVDLSDELLVSQPIEFSHEIIRESRESLRRLAQRLEVPEADQWVELGSTRDEILRVTTEQGIDLLVMGSHSRHGLALLTGSTTRSVLNNAPCDVLAVRTEG